MNPKFHPDNEPGDNHEPIVVDPPIVDPNNPQPPKPTPADDMAATLSKTYSSGLNDGKERERAAFLASLQGMGVEIVKGADGKPDISKSIATFKANATGSTDLLKQVSADYERQIGVERGQREDLEKKLQQQSIQFQLSGSVGRYDVVNRKGVMSLFTATYNLEDESGTVKVTNPDGTLVFDKTTGSPITLDAAVDLFLKNEPYLVKAQSRDGGVGEIPRKGTPSPQISIDRLQERFVEEKDPVKKAVLREQMMKAISEGKR